MIYYSVRTRQDLAQRRTSLPLGRANYSYAHVCRRFLALLSASEVEHTELLMPEIYASASSAPLGRETDKHVHISFKPFDEIRLLKGAMNFCSVYWEFSKLPCFSRLAADDPRRWNIFNDYTHILSKATEVWVACSFTQSVLQSEGVPNVHIVPAPLALPAERRPGIEVRKRLVYETPEPSLVKTNADAASVAGFLRSGKGSHRTLISRVLETRRDGGRVFVSVFNPGDRRKNAPALLAGFQKHVQQTGRNDLLIVKFIVDGTIATLQSALQVDLMLRFREAGSELGIIDTADVIYAAGVLSDAEMRWFYQLGDFYICTSSAEGQNLPLMEAISLGLIPISTAATAMADYISDRDAFVLPTTPRPIPHAYGLSDVTWAETTPADVARALSMAVSASGDTLDTMRRAGRAVLEERYSEPVIWNRIAARLGERKRGKSFR